jgi:hypothetical protein
MSNMLYIYRLGGQYVSYKGHVEGHIGLVGA